MRDLTHTTIDGVRYGVDPDGRVLAPDWDGTPDVLTIGRVARAVNPRWWDAFDPAGGWMADAPTRERAIACLADLFARGITR